MGNTNTEFYGIKIFWFICLTAMLVPEGIRDDLYYQKLGQYLDEQHIAPEAKSLFLDLMNPDKSQCPW